MTAFRACLALLLASSVPLGAQAECPTGALPAYAHNDYRNARPLRDALDLGFRGAEADVFLVDGILRLGHDEKQARSGPAFEQAYLAPLREVIERCGGLASGNAFLLNVEVKDESPPTVDSLLALLGRFAFDPAKVRVVAVGWLPPMDSMKSGMDLMATQYRIATTDERRLRDDIAQLDARVRLLSLDYGKTAGRWWNTAGRRRRWLDALSLAKSAAPDRLLRVHNVPADPVIYRDLLTAGVDLIGATDLPAAQGILSAR
jgi:hypothetical protein